MKRIIAVFIFVIVAFLANSQTYIQDGDRCFDAGEYACAFNNYDTAFKKESGKEKKIAEINLTRTKWCLDHIKMANEAFFTNNYSTAKDEYQKVLDSNPKDNYVLSQIEKCDNVLNPPKLRKATTEDLTDIWNDKYGVNPQRRQDLINAGIDPDDAQSRINSGEGKPPEKAVVVTEVNQTRDSIKKTEYIDYTIIENTRIDKKEKNQNRRLNSFSSLGFQSGTIAKYGILYENGSRKIVGFNITARSSLIPKSNILNGLKTVNKTEFTLGINLKISPIFYLNLAGGYGYYYFANRNDFAGTVFLEKVGYSVFSSGLMIRINRIININGGVSFMDIERAFYKPEITFGLSFNFKGR